MTHVNNNNLIFIQLLFFFFDMLEIYIFRLAPYMSLGQRFNNTR